MGVSLDTCLQFMNKEGDHHLLTKRIIQLEDNILLMFSEIPET